MTTYVLIFLSYYGRVGFTAEFNSKDKCELAAKQVMATSVLYQSNKYICVEK